MTSKTIILSSTDENNPAGRAILTISLLDGVLECRIRLYSFGELSASSKIGIYHKEQVSSANLLFKNGVYLSSLVGDFDLSKDFYVAIVDTFRNNKVLLTGGTYGGYFSYDSKVFSGIKPDNFNDLNDTLSDYNLNDFNFKHDVQEDALPTETGEFNKALCDDESKGCEDKCEHCKYKEYFYNKTGQESCVDVADEKNESDKENLNKDKIPTVLEQIIPQFDNVFKTYPLDSELCELVPNSKFVKIVDGDESYSLGALFEDGEIKIICYAKFCEYNEDPPKELGEHFQWLPIDRDDPLSNGYYIVFQDASDLKIVEL